MKLDEGHAEKDMRGCMKKFVCVALMCLTSVLGFAQHQGSDNPAFLSSEFYPKYTASSVMMEEISGSLRIYAAQNLGRSLFSVEGDETRLLWNPAHLPWMEGVSGNGVGQTIQLSCDRAFSFINILNGYVDVSNPTLFRENGRARSLRIEDVDNGFVYQLDLIDEICFTGIRLERATTRVSIIITSVYEGSLHQDTCISAIIPEDSPSAFYFQGLGEGIALSVGRRR